MKKIKLNEKVLPILGTVTMLLILLYKLPLFSYYPDPEYFEGTYQLKENKLDTLNDEIRRAKNSLTFKEQEKENFVTGGAVYSGWNFGGIGLGELIYRKERGTPSITEDCISFPSVDLAIHEDVGVKYLSYYTRNREGYLLTMEGQVEKDLTRFTYKEKKVDYRYSLSDKQIYVPIKSSFNKWLIFCLGILFAMSLILLQIYALVLFFKFLIAIANNKAFGAENINRLRNIALITIVSVLLTFLVELLAYVVFILIYSSEGIVFKYANNREWFVVVAIFFYLMYIAFKRGMQIEEENRLTI